MEDRSDIGFQVLTAIRRIVRGIAEHSRTLSREAGLTVPQLMCLKAVAELAGDEEVTLTRVAEHVRLTPPTTSRIVDRLERAGLIDRGRGTKDRRRVSLVLTATGRARYETLPTPLQERFLERLMDLSSADRVELLRALERVIELMEAQEIPAAPMLAVDID